MYNVQERVIAASPQTIGALLDRLAGPDDPLWPTDRWPAIQFDRGLTPGATGGHGPIKYQIETYEPGVRARMRFDPSLGLNGWHELRVEPLPGGRTRLVHELRGNPGTAMRLRWLVAVRWLHEALLQDLLDNAERLSTGTLAGAPARHSPWVRLLRRMMAPRPQPLKTAPDGAALAHTELSTMQLMDAWRMPVPASSPRTAQAWHEAMFHHPPSWLSGLLRLRNRLAPLLGLEQGRPETMFPVLGSTADEVLIGGANADFRLRVSVYVEPGALTLSTLTSPSGRRGRLYLRLIQPFHAAVVRSMLRRAVLSPV